MNRRGFLGGLLALAAPAVITTPGLLMPVSTWALSTYGPGGMLTTSMIVREFNRRLQNRVPAKINRGSEQSCVDFNVGAADMCLSLEAFAERFIDPATANLADHILNNGGALSVGMELMPVPGWDMSTDNRSGVFARAAHGYDIWNDRSVMRLDVPHS